MSGFLEITNIRIPESAIDSTMEFLRKRGQLRLEAFSFWAGTSEDNIFTVQANIIPAQTGHSSKEGVYVTIGSTELHRLNVWLYEHKMSIIAQIHSHPGEAYHSDTDDAYPIATTLGCVSLVIPNFARQNFALGRCAIYRLNENKEWAYLDTPDVNRLFTIIY